jgi:hypothetical protein
MTGAAVLDKARGCVVGSRRARECIVVTRRASLRRSGKPIVGVALDASRRDMSTAQGKSGGRVVIEAGAGPPCRRMTHYAILRESGGNVVRIARGLKRLRVATHTLRAGTGKSIACMAGRTKHGHMSSRQRKTRPRMIELSAAPGRRGVARGAVLREPGRHMVR